MQDGLGQDALEGGEDYARCFGSSLPPSELEARLGIGLLEVGQAIPDEGSPLLTYDGGSLRPLPDLSFDHFGRP